MPSWADVARLAGDLPEAKRSSMHGAECYRVRDKAFVLNGSRVDGFTLFWCTHDDKAALLGSGDAAFTTHPHYDGHASILVDLAAVGDDQLAELVVDAWRSRAPMRLRKSYDA